MKGKSVIMLVLAAAVLAASAPLHSQDELKSLRGANPIDEPSVAPESRQSKRGNEPIPRETDQQPPLIPHEISAFQVNLEKNTCLRCHEAKGSESSNATPISRSHYLGREGEETGELSGSRYFCTLCHAPQADVEPLVGNEFKSAAGSPEARE